LEFGGVVEVLEGKLPWYYIDAVKKSFEVFVD
jgi:hypothetical protein